MVRRLLLLLLPLLLGCAHFRVNPPFERLEPARGYRFENAACGVANTNSVLVCVAFSGGGTRAGALAYGAVRALHEARIREGTSSLLEEVDVISASSGGAFPAAYLGLFGVDRFLEQFRERVLYRDLGMEIFWKGTLCPYNLIRICSPWYNRSELADELYEDTIFGSETFSHLQRRGRPFVVLNSTDLARGERFEFTQDRFDQLGSSLGLVPICRAVAASSAFPFLLTPVAFQDYTAPEESRSRWVHLTDAGIVDNLGLGWVKRACDEGGALRSLLASGQVETFVLIVINARSFPFEEMGASPQAPGFVTVLSRGLSAAIDMQAPDLVRLVSDLRGQPREPADNARGPALHLVQVDLRNLPAGERRERLLAVETTFGLEQEVVDELVVAGHELLADSPAFQKVLAELR